MGLGEELRKLEDMEGASVAVAEAATCGVISISGSYDAYEHITEKEDLETKHQVGAVIANMPASVREALVDSYGVDPRGDGLSPRELNLIITGVQIAVTALKRCVQITG
jgi:hypothetical protein